jgi:hypothetical protein
VAPLPDEIFVEPGTHTVEARRPGYETATWTFEVGAGSTDKVALALRVAQTPPPPAVPETKRSVVPGAVLGGIAGAAVVTGAALLGVGASKRSQWQPTSTSIQSEHHTCVAGASNYDSRCAQLSSGLHFSDALHDAGVGVLVGSAVLTAGAIAYFLWPAPIRARSGASGLHAAPLVSATSAGLLLSGSF